MEAINGDKLPGIWKRWFLPLEEGEAHGLEILHRLEEAGCGLLRLKEGSLYPALYRLEKQARLRRPGSLNRTAGAAGSAAHLLPDGKGSTQARCRPSGVATFVRILGGILGAPA